MSVTNTNHRFGDLIGGSWQLEPDRSSIEFRTRAMWGLATVKGRFDDYHGELDLSAKPAIAQPRAPARRRRSGTTPSGVDHRRR